jgi:hypothetical protein
MIITKTGVPGKGMGVDMNIEHCIDKTKVRIPHLTTKSNKLTHIFKGMFVAKGIYADWDRLSNISAAIDVLDEVQKNVSLSLDTSYKGTTHTTPDTSDLVWRVANKACELKLNEFQANREGNSSVKETVDTLASGERLLKSATIATFNKKLKSLISGMIMEDETDDIPPLDLEIQSGSVNE